MSEAKHTSALLVVDVQKSLLEREESPIYKGEELIETINVLIDRARAAKRPIIFVQHASGVMPVGSDGWQIHPDLHRDGYDLVVQKSVGNAFEGSPSLNWILKDKFKVDTVYVTGAVTNACVRKVSLAGMDLGYRMFLVADGHRPYDDGRAQEAIAQENQAMAKKLTGVVAAADVGFE